MDLLEHAEKHGFNEISDNGWSREPADRIGRLSVSADKFNQVAKAEIPEEMVKSLKGFDYMNVAHGVWMVKQYYPTLTPKFVRNAEGDPFVDLPGDRGTMLGVTFQDSVTGCCTEIHWFPIMGRSVKGAIKPAELEPDARSINDNMARALVKAAAYFLGIGFSIYSRIEGEALEEAELGVAKPVEKTTKTKTRSLKQEEPDEDDYDDEEDEDEDIDEEDEDEDEDEEEEQPRKSSRSRSSTKKYSARLPLRGRK